MTASLAVIGGSGFYKLLKNSKNVRVKTPYGEPSAKIALGEITSKKIAFLPRHGEKHQFPPHKIPYKANLWALKSLGVERVVSVTACGSLQKKIKRGDFVILDQFIDRTRRSGVTFYDGPETYHVSTAYPYCPELAKIAYQVGKNLKIKIHTDSVSPGQRALIVDDLVATGGTALATAKLVEQLEGKVAAFLFLNELSYLRPRQALRGYRVISLVKFRK